MRTRPADPANVSTTPMPGTAEELARRAWELHEQAVAEGDFSAATRLFRTAAELAGHLGEAQRRRRSSLAEKLKAELAALDEHVGS